MFLHCSKQKALHSCQRTYFINEKHSLMRLVNCPRYDAEVGKRSKRGVSSVRVVAHVSKQFRFTRSSSSDKRLSGKRGDCFSWGFFLNRIQFFQIRLV